MAERGAGDDRVDQSPQGGGGDAGGSGGRGAYQPHGDAHSDPRQAFRAQVGEYLPGERVEDRDRGGQHGYEPDADRAGSEYPV